jgi:chemotaxis methyl-accepting protein methylase
MIICRDVLSTFDYNEQFRIISEFYDKLKSNGILILGDNEKIKFDGLEGYQEEGIIFYRKNVGIR